METQSKTVNIQALNNAFAKIAKYMDKYQLSVLETELRKMVPSANSEVLLTGGCNITDNTISLHLFVTNPIPRDRTQTFDFLSIIYESIIRTEIEKLCQVYSAIELIEKNGIDNYELDFTELDYDDEINEYYTHLTISKLLK